MASLWQRKDREGKWRLTYYAEKRYQIDTGTSDYNVALLWKAKAEELISLARLGVIDHVGRIGEEDVFGKGKENRQRLSEFEETHRTRGAEDEVGLSRKTLEAAGYAFRSFMNVVGDRFLDEYTVDDVRAWNNWMKEHGRADSTRSIYGRALTAALNRGVEWKLVNHNPFSGYKWPSAKQTRKRGPAMSMQEVRQVLNYTDARPRLRKFGDFIRFSIYTGLRRSEILNLKGSDVDLVNKVLGVWILKKRGGPERMAVPIPEPLYDLLKGLELEEDEYIFRSNATEEIRNQNRPWTKYHPTHQFKRVLRALDMPERYTLHGLRKTYVSWMTSQGVPIEAIQRLIGHSSSEITWMEYDRTEALDFRHHLTKLSGLEEHLDEQ